MLDFIRIIELLKSKVFMSSMQDRLTLVLEFGSHEKIYDHFTYQGLHASEDTNEIDLIFRLQGGKPTENIIISVDFDTCKFNSIALSSALEQDYIGQHFYVIDMIHNVYLPDTDTFKAYTLEQFRDYIDKDVNTPVLNLVDNQFYYWDNTETFPIVELFLDNRPQLKNFRIEILRHKHERFWLIKPRVDGTKLIKF